MRLSFTRVGDSPIAVMARNGGVSLEGFIVRKEGLVLLNGAIKGGLRLTCDRCANEYEHRLNESVELLISDGIFEPRKDEEQSLAVVEVSDGAIDIEAILESEIQSIVCDYHRCEKCGAI
ncbi:MAG: DUF177 domain-containing protein [Helicobacteraceae bacterium]|jgi:uncharacterized metal-binding protein YceD (DUF177 family)|nr:DUF177 domain-containing protein [Helicobacteraceae bacterium]